MHERKSWKPLMALIGARPSLTLFAYFHHVMMLVLYLLVSMMAVLLIVTEVMTCVKVIQHPLKTILPWLQQYGLTFAEMIAFSFAASLIVYVDAKQAVKQMKGLVALTRADPSQSSPVILSEYVEVSMPAWLQSLPQVDLPGDILDTLQQHIHPEESWVKNLATYLKEGVTESLPSISMLVSLRDRVTISVLGQNGKRQHITITQEQTAALIGFLALREKGVWVRRQEVIQPIYGTHDEHVTKHVSRLNDSLNKAVQKVGVQTSNPENSQPSSIGENKLKLIEYDESGKENLWRLLITCEVEIFPEVVSLYEQISAANNDPNIPPPDRDTLNSGCHRMMEHYGNGLFASYQKNHPRQYWSWATPHYTAYQEKCLFVLAFAAKSEWAYAMSNKHKADILHAAIRQTAQLYAWSIKVALGIIPNLAHAEQAVCACLKLYRMVDDLTSAQDIFQTYVTYRIERKKDWEPPARMINIWPEATSLSESSSASQKFI